MNNQSIHVLVLEDDYILSLALLLQSRLDVFHIVCVQHLEDCLTMNRNQNFDWILLDFQFMEKQFRNLPTIAAQLKFEAGGLLELVAVSTSTSYEHRQGCRQAGFSTTIPIPVDLIEVQKKLVMQLS